MTYTITRDDGALDLDAIRQILSFIPSDKDNYPAWYRLRELADSIEEQVKPAIEDPMAFGSLVRARSYGPLSMLWQRSPENGKHYWESDTGAVEVWSALTDVLVLRVGIGEESGPAYWAAGFNAAKQAINGGLRTLRSEAITSERQSAYDRALEAVEEMRP